MNEKEFFQCIIMAILLQRGDFNLMHQNEIAEKLYHQAQKQDILFQNYYDWARLQLPNTSGSKTNRTNSSTGGQFKIKHNQKNGLDQTNFFIQCDEEDMEIDEHNAT